MDIANAKDDEVPRALGRKEEVLQSLLGAF